MHREVPKSDNVHSPLCSGLLHAITDTRKGEESYHDTRASENDRLSHLEFVVLLATNYTRRADRLAMATIREWLHNYCLRHVLIPLTAL